jgi:hypothetical protein
MVHRSGIMLEKETEERKQERRKREERRKRAEKI